MKLKLLDTNEVTLETKDKLCKENISLVVDNTNIKPENIKKDVSILGINGTYEGSGSSIEYWGGSFSGDLEEVLLGYTLRFDNTLINQGLVMYSIDEGSSWIDLYGIQELSGIEQIMFTCSNTSSGSIVTYGRLDSSKLNLHLYGNSGGTYESSNIILTEDVSDIIVHQAAGAGGGYN